MSEVKAEKQFGGYRRSLVPANYYWCLKVGCASGDGEFENY